jgi:hypothetical protein
VSGGMASCERDAAAISRALLVMGDQPGAIVDGFDVHRRQITVDALDTATGEVSRGRSSPRRPLSRSGSRGSPTGRFMPRLRCAQAGCSCVGRLSCGAIVHLAELVETSALRGRTRRAKTERTDARGPRGKASIEEYGVRLLRMPRFKRETDARSARAHPS